MFAIFWPVVIIVTIILYILMIITLPFSSVHATVFLFAIVAFWSRIPGVGMPSPMYVLYLLDFVDFFSLIIAVNIGGVEGAIFSLFGNLVGRMCGVWPNFLTVLQDSIAQAIVCLIIPFIHIIMGGDIFISMIMYSVLRLLLAFPLYFIIPDGTPWGRFVIEVIVAGSALIAINAFYAKLFGPFFDSLLEKGVQFNWTLFLIVTIVIIIGYNYMIRKTKRKISIIRVLRALARHGLKGVKKYMPTAAEFEKKEKKKKVQNEAPEHIKELNRYIDKSQKEGCTHESIRSIILKQGWSEEHIKQAYEYRQKK